jgi:hypothetical protein
MQLPAQSTVLEGEQHTHVRWVGKTLGKFDGVHIASLLVPKHTPSQSCSSTRQHFFVPAL